MNASLKDYVTLGRSGLRVSPLCLGTMTFGTEWGWGTEEDISRAIFGRYTDEGGNFLYTADLYTGGKSEEMLGRFIKDGGSRDRVVIATKLAQLENNLGAIEFTIPADLRQRLDDASALEPAHPYLFFDASLQAMISGGTSVQSWAPARVYGKATVLEAKARA